MKRTISCLIALSWLATMAVALGQTRGPAPSTEAPPSDTTQGKKALVYHFDDDKVGQLPPYLFSALTGQGTEGTWMVLEDETAPSPPNVLAQVSTDTTDYRFPLAVLKDVYLADLDISVKVKAVSGKVDQAGGLVFRYQDHNNYYIVRANALEDNYRLYHVVNGRRRQFAGANFRVTPNQRHTLRVECVGNQMRCYYDGTLKITATDNTFKNAGKVGLWTKADSVTYFDDLTVTAK